MNYKEILWGIISDVNTITEKKEYNKYIKMHPIGKIFALLLYHQYAGLQYGRSLTLQIQNLLFNPRSTPSQGELSKKLQYRLPVELWTKIYQNLLMQAKNIKSKKLGKAISRLIRIIDSTHLTATPSMKWAKHRKTKNGLKIHLMIDGDTIPNAFKLKNGNSSDKKSLKWAIKQDFIYVFDRGYNDFSMFAWIGDQGASFVTRASANIHYETIKNHKVGNRQKEKGILADSVIRVIKDRKSGETLQLRMVSFEFIDSKGDYQNFSLLTDLKTMRSDIIADIYRERWNIEVVFYWIKTFLKVKHWMSRSKNGLLIQLYSALIAYLMVLIARLGNNMHFKIMRDYAHKYSGIILRFLAEY